METLLTVREVAARYKLSKSTLDKLRSAGGGPPYIRLGRRRVVYAIADLEAWIAERRHTSTAEYQSEPKRA